MKEFEISVFITIFEEMFGFFLWWSLVVIGVVVATLFFYFIIKEKFFSFKLPSITALFGAIIAIFVVLSLTDSTLGDLNGTVDFVLIFLVALSGAIATFACVYVIQSIYVKLNQQKLT